MTKTKEIQFIDMQPSHHDEVLEMMKPFYASPAVLYKSPIEVLERDFADCVNDNPYLEGYVFVQDGAIIGYSMVAKSYTTEYGGLCLWIEDLYIKSEVRSKGIAGMFFSFLESKYEGKAVRYKLEVEEENQHAIAAYRKNGYAVSEYYLMTKEV